MVPMVVEKRGGDPVSICMNTVAILFLLDVDNQCYSYGLPDHIRAEVEEHGRVVLDEADVKFMSKTKTMYIFVLAVLMPWSVATIEGGDGIMSVSFYLGVAGIVEQAVGPRLQALLKPGQRLVSKAGALWRWDGFVASADAPTAAAIRLEQKNRLAELDGVDEMEIDRKTGVVTLFPEPGKHIFHAINEYVTQRRLPVDTLTLETGRLDEVFRDITTAEAANG